MPQYRYQAQDESQRPIAGEIDAETVSQAISALEAQGLVVQSIIRTTADSQSAGSLNSSAPRSRLSLAASPSADSRLQPGYQELQSLLTKALQQGQVAAPLLRAYAQDVLAGSQRQELNDVVDILETGDFERALVGFRDQAQWWFPLLGATAQASTPGAIFERFVERVGPMRELRRRWWLVLTYPLLLVALVFAVTTIVSWRVVPTFQEIFDSFGSSLPFPTEALLAVFTWLRSRWALALIGVLVMCALLMAMTRVRSAEGRKLMKRSLALLPAVLTPCRLRSLWIGRFAAYLADLLEAGATASGALRVAGLSVERPSIRAAAGNLADAIDGNSSRQDPNPKEGLSATVVYALQSPLQPSAQVHLLREISHCQLQQSYRRGALVAAIGPISVVAVGLIVGWMLLALFAPLIQLVGALSG